MICFADLVPDQATRGYVGWSMVATMVLNIILNFGLILSVSITDLFKALRLKYYKRKNARLKKQIRKRETVRI